MKELLIFATCSYCFFKNIKSLTQFTHTEHD